MFFRSMILLTLVFATLAGAARAGQLCDAQCEVDISFPNGGWIVAHGPVTMTFGDSGLIDTVGSVIAYVDGETLTLNAGDRLDFGNGGSFDLGDGGNIEFTDLEIFSDGNFNVAAIGGSETIEVSPGSILSVFGGADLVFKAASVALRGGLELSASGQLGLFNDIATGCGITAHATDAVRLSLVTVAVTADNNACGRLLSQALVEVINPGSSDDDDPPPDSESSDATAFPLSLALFMLVVMGAAVARQQRR